MASGSSTSTTGGVPPGFRFHPTDEELLLYYLRKKISLEKFELEVIREIDLNKIEPWELQERCRIGSTPQNEWYFFSHKDPKYPTGSRTNRATGAGFWKATGRDKCIRVSYGKIGMRKTLVFYRGRAPHGQKTDWIMHEYRLDDTEFPADHHHHDAVGCEDGWVVCRVFKKKCFFKLGGGGRGSEGRAAENHSDHIVAVGHEQNGALSSHFMHPSLGSHYHHHHHRHHLNSSLYYSHLQSSSYNPHGQVLQDLLTNHRPSGYEFGVLPDDSSAATARGIESAGMQVDPSQNGWTTVLEGMEGRLGGASAAQGQMNEMANLRGSDMELWGYGK